MLQSQVSEERTAKSVARLQSKLGMVRGEQRADPFCFCHFKGLDLHIDRETDMIKVEGEAKDTKKSVIYLFMFGAFARRLAKGDDDHHRRTTPFI